MSREPAGYTLLEIITVIAIIGAFVLAAVPALSSINKRRAVRVASQELRGVFHEARSRAISKARHVGLRFIETGDQWSYEIYEDGDWDGLSNADIKKGIDKKVSGPRRLLEHTDDVRIALPTFTLSDPEGKVIPEGKAVRFGKSLLCSFSPRGSSSSGSIFLTDGDELVAMVRVYGPTAKIRSMIYHPRQGIWK
ncbi:MAG: prepilin-type N-terminal cleavage/methylation domain-containing protein [Acidobacteria bacterium]|nr:prepilin-type N-terminal cleavage/methylation domain-containing protein [Acidobacteriota bacterium]